MNTSQEEPINVKENDVKKKNKNKVTDTNAAAVIP